MKTNHTLLRLHYSTDLEAKTICLAVQGFMSNKTGKDFNCFVENGENWYDVVAFCTDQDEKIAHAVAWGATFGYNRS